MQVARENLHIANKVYRYRSDVLSPDDLSELGDAAHALQTEYKNKAGSDEQFESSIERLKSILQRTGGAFYSKPAWAENAEVFLVAAILAIGIRFFFFQPFKIPTNSMYPTYNGMTHEVYTPESPRPNLLKKILRKAQLWATPYTISAPRSGRLLIPINITESPNPNGPSRFLIDFNPSLGKRLGLFPTWRLGYRFYFDDLSKPVLLQVPSKFSGIDDIVRQRFYPDAPDWRIPNPQVTQWVAEKRATGEIIQVNGRSYLSPKENFKPADTALTFDILTGDTLFVDRFSYHFFKPKSGAPFVFRTGKIPGISELHGGKAQYYIKRLAGEPGDTLEIRDRALYRNGQAADGAQAFIDNAQRKGEYEGYLPIGNLDKQSIRVPEKTYYALGDNSDASSDSRVWGWVPDSEVIGKALFIFYPFSHRWGLAQ